MTESTLPKTYDFRAIERDLYHWWESQGFFKPSNDPRAAGFDPNKKPFVISIPPPNVTGELHLGHAMFVALEDLMIRYHRMRGEPTLWVPGSDHAGIATQLQVEKELLRTEEVTREELGREAFVARTWEWKRKYGSIIYDQLRRLGASCDWSRERFTLDEGLSVAVREAFVRLFEKGLIYRGPRLINWSPGLKTAVSDLEVEYSEEPGTLYYFKYRLQGSDDVIPVATTRPETILGDTAVAVHPDDERYQRFIGRTALVPVLDRPIPVIADEAVDREFGTGALKITPGHDPTDYEVGARHGLPIISMLDREARVTEAGGPYHGLDRFEARERLWRDMQAQGLTIRTEPYTLNVPRSQRGGEIVEPMISTQWFVTIQPLAEAALEAVRDGRIRIVPSHFEKVYFNWLENIKDWCISRQLWWGHRIPVWYCPEGHMTTGRTDPVVCATCGRTELEQDPDVLDTWFSSGLWPFSTLGWPERTPDLDYFYPTSVLETGYDILFFWVARMIMFGLEFTGQAPFHTVYLHGIIRDGEGRKMSKSLGNVVDPREVMDTYGTDALRFTLLTAGTPGNDLNLSLQRVESNRNFANKIWNMARFVQSHLGEGRSLIAYTSANARLSLADRWIVARLNQTIASVTRLIDSYEFGQAGSQAYEFLWGDFADWYIEAAKVVLAGTDETAKAQTRGVLVYVLDQALRLLHPYVPYITEAVWRALPHAPTEAPALIVARWPRPGPVDDAALADFGHLQEIIRAIRNARSENNVEQKRRIPATIVAGDKAEWLRGQRDLLLALARLDDHHTRVLPQVPEKPRQAIALVVGATEVYLPLEGLVDLGAERERLSRELSDLDRQIQRSEGLLGSDFANKAPAAVIERERAKLASLAESRQKVAERLGALPQP
jgi:valyl-tRNA synthetase